jgi:hypothetical protein
MEPFAMDHTVRSSAAVFEAEACAPRSVRPSRPSTAPGMTFGHDVLLAVIMAIAMGATVFLYR